MDRKEFLSALGYSSGALIFAACIGGCSKASTTDTGTSTPTPAPTIDFTIDLTQPANAALNSNGGSLVFPNGIIVAKTLAGVLIAVSKACTHQGTEVQYQSNNNQFYCPNHGALFSASGAVVNGPAAAALKQYTVTVTGNSVRVNG